MKPLEIDEIVNQKIGSMIENGKIEELINVKVEKVINSIIDSEISVYSEFGESLKAYINKTIKVDFDKLGFEGYNENLLRVISKVYERSMQSAHLDKVKKITEEMLANPPESITLSSLIEAVKEKGRDIAKKEQEPLGEDWTYEGEITCIIKGANDEFFTYLYLDPGENKSPHSCAYCIGISNYGDERKIFSLRMNDEDSGDLFVTQTYGLERLLFKAKCASSNFEFDVESPDLSYEVEIEADECHC